VVFHLSHKFLLAQLFFRFHLAYTTNLHSYTERIVKVHGVFPSSSREFRIFTERSISLDRYRRQWRSRYIIHAGRNLPAKEFRYLRTVRVTAAVYPGFRSRR